MKTPFSSWKFAARVASPRLLAKLPRSRRGKRSRASRYEPLEARCMLAPVAVNDSYQATANAVLTVNAASGVQANDTPDYGLPMTSSVVTNPGHGSVTLNSNGSFSYTLVTNYTGTDAFTYHDID